MTTTLADRIVPRIPVLGIALLLAGVLGMVALTRGLQQGQRETETPLVERALRFADLANGAVAVTDARGGAEVALLPLGEGGFLRGALRGLARERRLDGAGGAEAPFLLAAWPAGRLTLEDTATGRVLELHAYGHTNAEAFARLLTLRETAP